MRKESIEIILPHQDDGQLSTDLIKLTKKLCKMHNDKCYGGLGGQYGYGYEFENETFMMKPFCWCERDDCIWCMMNDPKENPNWQKHYDEIKEKFGKECADWGGAPQFLYKPTKAYIRWYKYIGRDQRLYGNLPKDWLKKCIKSL